ncbi:MAG: hypothetical protein ACP5L0_04580 [Caldisphaera sp.]|uniref:hypothetical protein n=1 Tax=Caldisphaera sp. TaxID=2060322 RepID=UPI0026A92BD7
MKNLKKSNKALSNPFVTIAIALIALTALTNFYIYFENPGNRVNLIVGNPRKPYDTSETKSLNWAGYAIPNKSGSFNYVNAG